MALGKAPKAMDFVRRLALRPLLGRTYRVWDEITKVYKRQVGRLYRATPVDIDSNFKTKEVSNSYGVKQMCLISI